ncbi:hypothetical protein MN116_000988 [Schistosoma mekongi]|uniref:Uncharacterized protein n=1 Tax=Schistosoma mekongi TaxID=38744 RepID=A0AAE1ZKV1_SCHME|nr:hypothetical protein MN116_000988 [Schistosoma mekongi]
MYNIMNNIQKSYNINHDFENLLSNVDNSTSTSNTTSTTEKVIKPTTPGNNLNYLNETIVDIENVLYKNCIELNQHEAKLITMLERSEAMEKNIGRLKYSTTLLIVHVEQLFMMGTTGIN